MIHIKKILYPTDFSPYSNQAYFHAIALAEKHRASLAVLYVYVPGVSPLGGHGPADRAYWQELLEQIRPTDATIPVTHILVEGDPSTEIVRYAHDAAIDLIVMGTHGRTGLERLLMGSVAEKVMRESPCSVLVVKLPKALTVPAKNEVAVVTSPA
ncbi:MAG TPA: universal stress protein [Gemmataceae bacterium]|nr:universal stress protein [Gemmataceae bacterium]